MTLAIANVKPICFASHTEYKKLKTKLKNTTFGYGSAIATSYFITQGSTEGLSAVLGTFTSYTYISLLEDHVDNIENSPFQKQFLAPIGLAIFETSWNNAPFSFDFDYGATLVGFLSYKLALTAVLYDMIRDMMIKDSIETYDTSEKKYNVIKRENDE